MDRLRIDEPAPSGIVSPASSPLGAGGDFTLSTDPWALFSTWMGEAERAEPEDPNAMALATAGSDGLPDVRMVLLKGVDERGFVFYTNVDSAKGEELAQNPQAALVLHWKSLRRQVDSLRRAKEAADASKDTVVSSLRAERVLGSKNGRANCNREAEKCSLDACCVH